MTPFDTLSYEIRSRLDRQEATGWFSCHCPVCKESRTRTGGFLFNDDSIVYNCFRGKCDASCQFTLGQYISKKFRHLMDTMGVKIPVEFLTVKRKKGLQAALNELDEGLYKKHGYKKIDIPDGFVPFDVSSKKIFKSKIEDFLYRRFSDTKDIFVIESGPYMGMGAIGMYFGKTLIGFHIITGRKYVAHFDGNSNVLYMPDRYPSDTTIVVEGSMDARSLPCSAATLGNKITREQAYFLRDRRVIMVPDRRGECKYIDQFAAYGWSICIPPWKENDVNSAVQRYGKIATMNMIMENTETDPIKARLRYQMWKE